MTNPPHGGSVSPSSTDFGATTLSGRTLESPGGAPTGTATEPAKDGQRPSPEFGDGHTRTDIPAAKAAPTAAPGLIGGPPPAGAPQEIRGIRTGRNRGPRRARLQIKHINPVTVLKFSCVLSIALFFVWLIIVGVLFGILDASGAIKHINDTVTQLNGTGSKPPITAGIVFGGAAIVGVINIVLFIALTTIGAVIYNLCADLVGGIEITLSER
jgi:hypothetical protein